MKPRFDGVVGKMGITTICSKCGHNGELKIPRRNLAMLCFDMMTKVHKDVAAKEITAEIERLIKVHKLAEILLAKIAAIEADPRHEVVWREAQAHLGAYDGPTYTAEVAALKEAVSVGGEG